MTNPVFLIVIPLLSAFLCLIHPKVKPFALAIAQVFNLAFLFVVEKGTFAIGGYEPPFGISLTLDSYSFIGVVLLNSLFAMVLLMNAKEAVPHAPLLAVALAGLNGMILTSDLFNLFVFMEITAIAAYILSSVAKKYHHSFQYLVLGSIGSSFFLLGIILLYASYGTLNMNDLTMRVLSSSVYTPGVLTLPILLIFIGLGVEAKILPFNSWVKGVYGNAGALVGTLLASPFALTVLLVIGRLFNWVLPVEEGLRTIFLVLAILTLLVGEITAYSRKTLREVLLFSSIGQAGLIVALFITGLVLPALGQLISNVVSKLILFSVAGSIADSAGSDEIKSLGGFFQKHKLIGISFTVASLSIMGLPLFYGFYAKLNLLFGLFVTNHLVVPAVILFATLIEGVYFVRLLAKLWNPGAEGKEAKIEDVTTLTASYNLQKRILIPVVALLLVLGGLFQSVLFTDVLTLADSEGSTRVATHNEGGM